MELFPTIAIVGVGLLGGSIGLAVRQRKLARRVIGIGRRPERLSEAVALGAVTETTTDLQQGVAAAPLAVICTPVAHVAAYVHQVAKACPADALITDVGSTKARIVEDVARGGPLPRGVQFVGSHPLAGSEQTGVSCARDDLFEGRVVVVTPAADDAPVTEAVTRFWEALGSRVLAMSPTAHDEAVAATSHVPHVVAAALAAATPAKYADLVASGWSDTTRVAAGDVELWRQILQANQGHVLQSLDNFAKVLAAFRDALAGDDESRLVELLQAGKTQRDALGS